MTAPPTVVPTPELVTARLAVWSTTLSLTARTRTPGAAGRLDRLLRREVDLLDRAANRFHDRSEISAVNRAAGTWVEVSWHFVDVLTSALDAASESGGLVDPCLGGVVDRHGYRRWRDGELTVPPVRRDRSTATPDDHRFLGAWRSVEIRPAGAHARVRIPRHVQLDLGAIGKAWLADRLARQAESELGCDVIADMGGDLRVLGVREPWVVAADPGHPGHPRQIIEVTECGLATSGTGRRTWLDDDGRRVSHVIDPRTGRPAELVLHTASVLARDVRGANTAATAAVILGRSATQWLGRRSLDAWLVGSDGTETRVGRWPTREQRGAA